MKKKLLSMVVALSVVSMATMAWAGAEKIEDLPYTINESGSYKIDENLFSTSHGIAVNADNVTIDFQGYTISGQSNTDASAKHDGIHLNGHSNVEIKNGTITNFSDGIYGGGHSSTGSAASLARVIDMRIVNNTDDGIALHGINHLVKDCTVAGNGSESIHLQDGGIVTGNLISNNKYGIESHGYTVVTGNSVYGNTDDGIDVSEGSVIIGNTVAENGTGIEVRDGSTVQNNAVYGNQLDGIKGMQTATYTASGNAAVSNNASGGEFLVNMTQNENSVLGVNVAP